MKDSRPGSNGRRRSSDDYSERSPSRTEGSKRRPSKSSGDRKARRRREDSGARSRKSVSKSREDYSRSPSRSSQQSDGGESPVPVTPPSNGYDSPTKDGRSPKKRSSKPSWGSTKHSYSLHTRERTRSVERGEGEHSGGEFGSSDGGSADEAHPPDKGSASESEGSNSGETLAPSEVATTTSKTPPRRTPSPRLEKASATTPSRLTPSPKSSSKPEGQAPPAEEEQHDSDGRAGEGVMDIAAHASDGGGLAPAEKAAVAASAEKDVAESDDREVAAAAPDRASSDGAGVVDMPAAEVSAAKPRPQVAADTPAVTQPTVETPVLQEKSAPVAAPVAAAATQDPAVASGGGVGQVKRVVGKKRPRPIKTGGSTSPKVAGPPVPVGASLLAQTPAVTASNPLTPNGKRSPASGKTGGKDKSAARGGSEKRGRGGSGGAGGTVRAQGHLTGSSPAPQARRTQRAAAVVAAGKIKSTSEGGGGSIAAGVGVGNGMLGGGGGGFSAFQSYGRGGAGMDDSEEEATLDGLISPNRGASSLSTSASKPLGPREWFCAKTKVVDMIAQDKHKVYTSSPALSIRKGMEYKSYLAMVQTPIWLQKIQDKIADKKTDCR